MLKKVFSLLLTLALVFTPIGILPFPASAADTVPWDGTIAEGFAGGNGSADDPYQIANGSQLAFLAQEVNSGESYRGKYFEQTADIDLGNRDWAPIGGQDYKTFSGTYLGKGHNILNLRLTIPNPNEVLEPEVPEPAASTNFVGLFGLVGTEAHIEGINLGINSISVLQNAYNTYIGGIAAMHSSPRTIENCNVSINGNINLENNSGAVYFGGIVGNNDGSIENCTTKISSESSIFVRAIDNEAFVGGITGNNSGTISNCRTQVFSQNPINITAKYCDAYVGGISGYTAGDIYNSDNFGKLQAEAASDSMTSRVFVGGIVGYAKGTYESTIIENCQNDADIESINNGNTVNTYRAYAGGIVGHIDFGNYAYLQSNSLENLDIDFPEAVQILNSANIGTDKRVYTKAPTTLTGGIAGSSRFTTDSGPSIVNSYNRSNIISEMSDFQYNKAPIFCTGVTAGGIIGGAGGINIRYSYSTASEVTATPLPGEDAYVGGFVGLIYGTELQQNYYEKDPNVENPKVSIGIGGKINAGNEIVPQEDMPDQVSSATSAQLKTKEFFGEGWQWYQSGGDVPQYYNHSNPWRFTEATGYSNDGYPALRGAPGTSPSEEELVPATNLQATDPDNNNPGVDGRDFQLSWTPSVSLQVTGQRIFILPEATILDTSTQHAVATFAGNITSQWMGIAALKTDSKGNPLTSRSYTIYLVTDKENQSVQTSKVMTAVPEANPPSWGDNGGSGGNSGGSSEPAPVYSLTRLSGLDRVDTALEIAKAIYPNSVSHVILATADTFPDALTGSVLAHKVKAPILLVGSSVSDQEKVLSYLESNLDKAGTVYILGGTGAVSQEMEIKVGSRGFKNITRLGGKDRYETALKIAEQLNLNNGTPLVLVNGENFPDALSISSTAAIQQNPILLIENNEVSSSLKAKMAESKPTKIYLIGQEGVISKDIETQVSQITSLDEENVIRIGGADRFKTSLEVAKYFKLSGHTVCIATGNDFPDALAGSLFAANLTAPLILVDSTLSNDVQDYLKSKDFQTVTIFGGEGAVSKAVEEKLLQSVKK